MLELTIALKNEDATAALGARLGAAFAAGDIVLLSGDLGAGKSTLARGVIKSLCGHEEAPSPTYTFVETYEAPTLTLWHFDFYRLEKPEDVWELGFEEALDGGVSLIEWPERLGALKPAEALEIRLEIKGCGRLALIKANENWRNRLAHKGID